MHQQRDTAVPETKKESHMSEAITLHDLVYAIALLTVAALALGPIYGAVWEISAARTRRRLAAEKERQ